MKIACCNQCFEIIAKQDTRAAKLWIDLCAYSAPGGNLGLMEARVPGYVKALRTLEKMGFILSRDGKDVIQYRINGCKSLDVEDLDDEEEMETFCINRSQHAHG